MSTGGLGAGLLGVGGFFVDGPGLLGLGGSPWLLTGGDLLEGGDGDGGFLLLPVGVDGVP